MKYTIEHMREMIELLKNDKDFVLSASGTIHLLETLIDIKEQIAKIEKSNRVKTNGK